MAKEERNWPEAYSLTVARKQHGSSALGTNLQTEQFTIHPIQGAHHKGEDTSSLPRKP